MLAGMKPREGALPRRVKERKCTMTILARFFSDEGGVTAIEYALIASLIALFIITAVQTVGTKVSTVFTEIGAALK
jgi:pilus assembly protein Flp/PilA